MPLLMSLCICVFESVCISMYVYEGVDKQRELDDIISSSYF